MMKKNPIKHNMQLSINNIEDDDLLFDLGRALSNYDRLSILRLLQKKPMNLSEISKTLDLPISSVSFHVDALNKARLIQFEYQPVLKGHVKLCYKAISKIELSFFDEQPEKLKINEILCEMPVGNYTDANVDQCYLVGPNGFIFREFDYNIKLFTPEKFSGQLLGFQRGWVSYNFPNHFKAYPNYNSISFSFEFCSEAPYFRLNWPSDITIWVNEFELTTVLSPSDFGGRQGKFTPDSWLINSTQYGILKTFTVNELGVFVDEHIVNKKLTINDLMLDQYDYIKLKIGIKDDAKHTGGLNLFGKNFGDYNQSIVMTLSEK
jgi:predicted transcriptional regulator